MAILSASNIQVRTVKSSATSPVQVAEITFNVAGTYVQGDNAKIADASNEIESSRRNGKTVTLLGAILSQAATKASGGTVMGLKTVAISTDDVTFELTDGDYTTELAGAAVPDQDRPWSVMVAFTEA
jgi:hypothetical protein